MCLKINYFVQFISKFTALHCWSRKGHFMQKLKGKFTTILNKIITDKSISGNEFKILCYLCMRSGNDNSCFPSLDTIHRDTGVGLTTIKNSIPKLVAQGYIVKVNRKKSNGSSTSNLYRLTDKVLE